MLANNLVKQSRCCVTARMWMPALLRTSPNGHAHCKWCQGPRLRLKGRGHGLKPTAIVTWQGTFLLWEDFLFILLHLQHSNGVWHCFKIYSSVILFIHVFLCVSFAYAIYLGTFKYKFIKKYRINECIRLLRTPESQPKNSYCN